MTDPFVPENTRNSASLRSNPPVRSDERPVRKDDFRGKADDARLEFCKTIVVRNRGWKKQYFDRQETSKKSSQSIL